MVSKVSRANALAGTLLIVLCTMTAVSGVSQQWFERAHGPEDYAARLLHDGTWLRALVAVDDLFIFAYVIGSLLLAARLCARWTPMMLLLAGGVLAAGVLDLEENHELLTFLQQVELGDRLPSEAIRARSVLSQLKWLLGHLAFVAAGLCMHAATPIERAFRAALIGMQPVLGVLCWTVTLAPWNGALVWARYAAFVLGFFFFAYAFRERPGAAERIEASSA